MDREVLYYEYEQLLLGNKQTYSPYYFKYGDDTAESHALCIIKYALEKYLRWSPYDVQNHFNHEISQIMKLEPLMKYITFPSELDKDTDYYYFATLLYPNIIKFTTKDLVLRVYKDVLSGKLCKFPKEYLSGTQGMYKAGICLQYMLNQHCTFKSVREMYEFFAGTEGVRMLREYRLSAICNEIYEHPIDYLHESLPEAQKDDYWYNYYRFKAYNQMYLQKQKKESKNKTVA